MELACKLRTTATATTTTTLVSACLPLPPCVSAKLYRPHPCADSHHSTWSAAATGDSRGHTRCAAGVTMAEVHYDQRPRMSSIEPRGSVVAVILGGGESDSRRLFPLTEKRTLPAIPIGGIYRLIDIPMSNLINSGINKIYILSQYQSTSLNRYLQSAYNFRASMGGDGCMEVVAATQGPDSQRWAEGAADAVRQFMDINFSGNSQNRYCTDIIILPSDQIYCTDFCKMIEEHRAKKADITIACHTVGEELVEQLGIVKVDSHGTRILSFDEKPRGQDIAKYSMDWADLDDFLHLGAVKVGDTSPFQVPPEPINTKRAYLASCGIYIFKRAVLEKLLQDKKSKDFGTQLLPQAIKDGYRVMAANLDGFWVDVGGSIGDYYKFNMDVLLDKPPFSFSGSTGFYACPKELPPVVTDSCRMKNVIIGPGCQVFSSELTSTVVGARTVIKRGCSISHSVIMGSDYYEHERTSKAPISPSFPPMGIGPNCSIRKAIIDKNARIGAGCKLLNKEGVHESFDRIKKGLCIRDGIIVVSKSSVVPDNTEI